MINMDDVVENEGGLVSKEQNGEQQASFTKLEGLLIAETLIDNCAETGATVIEHRDPMAATDASEMRLQGVGDQPAIGPSPADDDGPTEAKQDPLDGQSSEADGSTPGSQKKGLRVSFPEDKVVSGYMDPPTPWNDASKCSTDELVAAYLSACEKLGAKPNARLLGQLQVITNFDDRNETLTLKNENLDTKHCETLEEVFRRVQFRTIDLEATKLEEEGAVTIFDMIEYYESCMKLNISYSKNLGQRGWQACSRMIRKTPCLENLEVRGSSLSDFVMPFLGRSLRVGSALTSLHLEFTVTSGKPLQILVAALKVNETLKELYLADNKLMPSDGIQLGSLLKYNRTLHLLDLRNNHLQDTGFQHICDGVWEQGKSSGLNTLVIWNNQLSYQAMTHLSRALSNSTALETLNLGHNNLTNEGMHRLKESLLKNKSLLRIGLQASKITCEGAVALAEFIAESLTLVRLDLRENEIKTGGLMALSLALKVSQSVTRIDLDKDPKKESGIKDYADQQKRLLADISNFMQRNRALARQREEEEIAQETDCSASTSPPATADETDVKDESIPAAETTSPLPEETGEELQNEVCAVSEEKEEEVESFEEIKGPECSPRHRMNLTLELNTRCRMLESPDFIPESEMQAVSPPPPEEQGVLAGTPLAIRNKRKIMMDVPQSPMVSSQGRNVLVPVFEDPLSPSLDDMTPLTRPTKPYDVMSGLDTDCVTSMVVTGCQVSTPESNDLVSTAAASPDEFSTTAADLEKASSMPSSPDESFSSASSQEDSLSFSLRPVLSRSVSLPADVPPGRSSSQHRKSSLKATRQKHRFQVSKTILPHKPPLGRRGSGSHKHSTGVASDTLRHGQSDHSTIESAKSPFSTMLPLTSFQLKTTAPENSSGGDGIGLKTTDASCDKFNAPNLFPDASLAAEPSPAHPPRDDQTTSSSKTNDSLQVTPVDPAFPTPETTTVLPHHLSANGIPQSATHTTSVDSETTADANSSTPREGPVNVDVATLPNTEDNGDVNAATVNDFPAEHLCLDLVGTSGETASAESVPDEGSEVVAVANSSSPSSGSDFTDAEVGRSIHSEVNGIAMDVREPHELELPSSGSDKTSRLSNGLKLGFPHDVIDLADLADDVRKLHLENTATNSDDHFDAKKSMVEIRD